MTRRAIVLLAVVFTIALGCAQWSLAQDPDDVQQGIKAYGTYRGGEIDSVSMTNGNLILDIPLVSYPQRGKLDLGYKLVYNNKNYKQVTTCSLDICRTDDIWWPRSFSPLKVVADKAFTIDTTWVQIPGTKTGFSYYFAQEADGAKHTLGQLTTTDFESVDATGFRTSQTANGTRFAIDSNGTRYGAAASQEDVNGNQIFQQSNNLTDTVGRTIPIAPPMATWGSSGAGNCPTGPLPVDRNYAWSVPGPNGGTSTFLFCWALVNVVIDYDITDGTQTNGNIDFLQSVVLPNGKAWTFQYSNDGNGDLTQITFPTGGTIAYTWTSGWSCGTLQTPPRFVTSRTVNSNDGTGNHTWTYSYSGIPNPTNTTTVTDPLGNATVYTNTDLGSCHAYTTSLQHYQGAVSPSNLLKTVSTTYSSSPSPFAGNVGWEQMNIVPTQVTTTWASGKTSMVTKTYDSGFTFTSPRPNDPTQYTGIYGKVTVEKEYDYGNNQAGQLLRVTNTSYAWQSGNPHYSNYQNNNVLNLVYSSQVQDGLGNQVAYTQYGYDETAVTLSGMGPSQNLDTSVWTGTYRGNQTSVNRWLNLPTVQTITSTASYYDTGLPYIAKDPLLNPTTYGYSSTFQDAYVTQVTNALNQTTYFNYDFNTGLKTSTTDPNGQVTTESYDAAWRLTNVTGPPVNGQSAQTSFCYSDESWSSCLSSPPYQVVITKAITSTKNKTVTAIVDGLGRLAHTQLNSDPSGIDYVDDTYDPVGSKATSSNPYRTTTDSTYGISTNTYDALKRVTQVTQPDSSILKTAYCGNTTLVTDEAGHWRRSTVDGLGRLIEVDEPNSPTATVNSNGCPGSGEPIWVTTYGYDTLDNVISVLQAGSRARSFTYDSLSRLLTANNPESGTLTYAYDPDGNVTTKVTPTQNQPSASNTTTITYCYDSLNRLTAKGYDTAQDSCTSLKHVLATYSYDGSNCLGLSSCSNISHRTGMTDAAGSESWAYDAMGRVVVQSRTTNSITKTTSYTYNLDSSVGTMTYPSGRVMTYTPDTAGRPSNVQDGTTSVYYATGTCPNGISGNGICYSPHGDAAQIQSGSSLVSTHIYNNRLQPCWTYATTGTALAWNTTLCNSSESAAGNMLDLKYNFNLGGDNGSLLSVTNNRVSDRSQSFTYDQLNRVVTAQTTATHSSDPAVCWGQAFGYDTSGDWSNLLSISGVSSAYIGCTQGTLSVTVNTKNQITTDTYDAAGNLMTIPGTGGANYVYNAENQLTSTSNSSTQYVYDGDGNRVMKSGSKIYWFAGSEILDETDTTGSFTNASFSEYVFFGGARVARRDASNNVYYYLTDQVGSSRVIAQVLSGQTTATMCYDADFEPFGGEHAYLNTCPQNYKFTGKERDSESNLDNFGARYYASTTGRFMTPDWALKPVAVPYAKFGDPQTLNLYTYVENSPLNRIDADGHEKNQQQAFGACFGMIDCFWASPAGTEGDQKQAAKIDRREEKSQPQNKYDPNKTGPEDPTNPGNPLFQNKDVKKESDKLFMSTTNGEARSGLAESGVAIDYKDGKISFGKEVSSVHGDGKPNELKIPTDDNTIAVLHTHGNRALPTPSMPTKDSPGDVGSKFPNFVRSKSALYVTVPGTTTYIQLVPAPSN